MMRHWRTGSAYIHSNRFAEDIPQIIILWASNSVGLEYLADTEEVGGSNPSLPTIINGVQHL